MSDAIDALNKIVYKAAEREEDCGANETLLEEISIIAGDSLEDHVRATDRAKPRKERVYKQIVDEIAPFFEDNSDLETPEGVYHICECVGEILDKYKVRV